MSQLKHLLEKATQKNEMKWRVYAYDPAKDNKLVHTSELFDDINGAGIEKAEWLKKHPEHTIEIIAEAAQKNEDRQEHFRFRLQTDDERKRVKALDRLSNIKEKNGYYYVTFLTKTNSAGELAEYLRANKIYPVDLLGVTDYTNESADIDVKNPGVLEVPDGKKVDELPQSHFEKLVDKKGYAEVIRALTNLEVWNKDKNKSLSSWASNMADKLKKKYRPESTQKNEANPNAEKTLITKKQTIQRLAAKLTNDNLLPQLKQFKDYVDDVYNFALKNFDESAQINETRSYTVTVKLEVPDKMNNRDIEDYIENKVDNSNFGVYVLDVTAERA